MDGLASLLARTLRHSTCSLLHFCRYLLTSISMLCLLNFFRVYSLFFLIPHYYLPSYVIGLECFMVSLRDLFYVCSGSKQNQRRVVVLRAVELRHWREQASSLLRRRKQPATHGTASGLRMGRGSKGPICVQVDFFCVCEGG